MAKLFLVLTFLSCYTVCNSTINDNLCLQVTGVTSPCSLTEPERQDCSSCDIKRTCHDNDICLCDISGNSNYTEWRANQLPLVSVWQGQTVVRLTNIDLKPAANAQYYLSLRWTIVKPEYTNLTRGFLLQLSCRERCNGTSETCLLVDYLSYLNSNVTSFTAPNVSISLGILYNLTITSLPSNEQTTYVILVPSTPPQENLTLTEWVPVIAVSADSYNTALRVIFGPAPPTLNASNYTVFINNNSITLWKKTFTQQTDPVWDKYNVEPYTNYSVQLSVYGSDCLNGCDSLPGPDVLKVFLLSVPSPVPWGVSTDTPVTPPHTTDVTPKPSPGEPDQVTVVPTKPEPKNDTKVYIIIGVLVAVVVLIALVIILFTLYRRRHRATDNQMGMQILGKDFNADTDSKIPSVLILYSYDCPAHEQVVIEFSNFLRSEWRLEVYLDLWEQKDIAERGCTQWLQEKLIRSQFIIVVSSTGARIKCARNRQSRMKYDRAVPDMFCDAIDSVLQRSHANKLETAVTHLNSQPTLTCLVVCFPYSCENDIPPKLDTWERFSLMKDLYELYCKLSCAQQDNLPSKFPAISPSKYKSTRLGKQLSQVLNKAIEYFDNNRDWVAERLEPLSPPMIVDNQKKQQPDGNQQKQDESQPDPLAHSLSRENSPTHVGNPPHHTSNGQKGQEPPGGHSRMSSSISSVTEEDALLLEERRKKRQKEEEGKMEKVPSAYQPLTDFNKDTDKTDGMDHLSSTSPKEPQGGSSLEETEDYTNNIYQNGEDPTLNQHHGTTLPIPIPSSSGGKNGENGSVHSHSQSNSQYSSLNRSRNQQPDSNLLRNGFSEDPHLLNCTLEDELQRDIAFILNEQSDFHTPSTGDNTYLLPTAQYPGGHPLEFQQANDANLSFLNPIYSKMNGDANKPTLYGASDRNENFIIDLGNPQEALDYLTQSSVERQVSNNSERGTDL